MIRKSLGNFLMLLGVILIGGALGLTAYNIYEQNRAEANAERAFAFLTSIILEVKDVNQEEDHSLEEQMEIPDYILNPEMDMPLQEVDGIAYVGYLTIPVLDLELPVISETNLRNLKQAPCRYTGSVYLNNLVIGAHNYARHFGKISDLLQGDKVYFTDMDGNRFSYQVADFEVLKPQQAEELTNSGWDLTLYTCTLSGQTRFTVRCEIIKNNI